MLFAVLALLAVEASAYKQYFSIGNEPFLRTRLDPLISNGTVSSHVHAISGTSNSLADKSFADARAGECSTSFIQDDKSSYWVPQLYYKWKNETYSAIQGDGLVTYWKYATKFEGETFAVVPDDFRMYAGDPTRDHFDPTDSSHRAISFQCIGDGYDFKYYHIPTDRECQWIRPQAFFPNCWNGKDAYLPGNAHVSYPTGSDHEEGPCPTGFVRIPSLFIETYYKLPENLGPDYEWEAGRLVFANGDTNGFTFHADWLNGWPSGMLVDAYHTCADTLLGNVDGCSVFEASRDEIKAKACRAQGQVIAEAIGLDEPLAQLPGNNREFNSSRDSPDYPKQAFTDYVENAKIVTVDAEGSGTCNPICHDYVV